MQITNGRLVVFVLLAVAGGLLIRAMDIAAAVVTCLLVCYLIVVWYHLYRRYSVAGGVVVGITTGIGACAVAAVLMEAGKVLLLTLLCVIIANWAANILYALYLKRTGVI